MLKYAPASANDQGSDLVSELASRVLKGDHRALAKAISIVEGAGVARRRLIHELYPRTGNAFTVGVTGPTGTGKSTLVDKIIQEFRKRGRKVGVLAIDPSSPFTGGAILGDRIRMMDHSLEREVYIRSMASRGDVGGLARAAINTIRVLDAAGMDVVIVETVGAGQTEVQVATAVDATVVVLMPQLGDEVQAFKAGFNEIGDIFVVNKADITNPAKTMFNVASGLQARNGWRPPVLKTVAIKGIGVSPLVDSIEKFRKFLEYHGLREERVKKRLESELIEAAFSDFYAETASRLKQEKSWQHLLGQVARKEMDPETAASKLVKAIARLDVSPNA
ncbi:MAG TPA: methylmalonyl Co-A mutase-associated GTPase MeaB [Candidatus Angelobacter sp.]|nr:methylmalonyl Co-A mutase-associated GTPase MeaB [Candidatus Angelobacter sp.]